MRVLYPAMLAGLLGLVVPVVLHLIARHRFPVRDYPTIRLLRYERRDNAFARRLVDPWQLLLRLLVLLLLVLAMARLFSAGIGSRPPARNLIVLLDASAGMAMRIRDAETQESTSPLEVARDMARELLASVALPSRSALVVAGDTIEAVAALGPDPAPALAALESIVPGDGTGPGLVRALAVCAGMLRGRREAKSQIVVLTDRSVSSFATRHQRDLAVLETLTHELDEMLDILVLDTRTGTAENLAIIDGGLRSHAVNIGDDAHVQARIRNFGSTPRTAVVELTVGVTREAESRDLKLAPGDEVVIDLPMAVDRPLRVFAGLALRADEPDALPGDDMFTVPLVASPARRALIVDGSADAAVRGLPGTGLPAMFGDQGAEPGTALAPREIPGARILQFAINPGRELGLAIGTGVETDRITADALPAQTLSRYDMIWLYNVDRLPGQQLEDLHGFVAGGRGLVIICSASLNPLEFNAALAGEHDGRGPLAPASLGTGIALDTPAGVTHPRGPWLAPFADRRRGDLAVVRIAMLRQVMSFTDRAEVLLETTDGHPVAVGQPVGEGQVVLLTTGLESDWSNLALTRVFPLLVWRLADHLTGRLRPPLADALVAAQPAVLDVADAAFRFDDLLELTALEREAASDAEPGVEDAPPYRLTVGPDRTALVEGLPVGRYRLQRPLADGRRAGTGYSRPIAVNHDPAESRLDQMSEVDLRALLGVRMSLAPASAGVPDLLAQRGIEWWYVLILALTAVYFMEAVCGFVTAVRREDRMRAQESVEQPTASMEPSS